jgi:hypothetical protein
VRKGLIMRQEPPPLVPFAAAECYCGILSGHALDQLLHAMHLTQLALIAIPHSRVPELRCGVVGQVRVVRRVDARHGRRQMPAIRNMPTLCNTLCNTTRMRRRQQTRARTRVKSTLRVFKMMQPPCLPPPPRGGAGAGARGRSAAEVRAGARVFNTRMSTQPLQAPSRHGHVAVAAACVLRHSAAQALEFQRVSNALCCQLLLACR